MKMPFKDPNVIVIKSLHTESKAVEGDDIPEGVIKFVASTDSEDRDGDIIKQAGLDLVFFKSNPVFLWAHNTRQPPIGKGIRAEVKDGRFELDVQFDLDDEFAKSIYNKYKKGIMNAVSIGFMPVELTEREKGGYVFEKSEVYEVSAVPIGSNREALAVSRDYSGHQAQKSFAAYYKGISVDEDVPSAGADADLEIFKAPECEGFVVMRKDQYLKIQDFVAKTAEDPKISMTQLGHPSPDGTHKMAGACIVELDGDLVVDKTKTVVNNSSVDVNTSVDATDAFAQKVADLVASTMKEISAQNEQSESGKQFSTFKFGK